MTAKKDFWKENGDEIKVMSRMPIRPVPTKAPPEPTEAELLVEKMNKMTRVQISDKIKSDDATMLEIMVGKALIKIIAEDDYTSLNTLLGRK